MTPQPSQADIDAIIRAQVGQDTGATENPNLQAARKNQAASAARDRDGRNNSLIYNYNGEFSNWSAQVMNARIPNTNPPQPPMAFIVLTASDGWAYVVLGTEPVCPMPPIPSLPEPPPPVQAPSHVKNVPAGDITPLGHVIQDPATLTYWQKIASPTPFGTALYYIQVKSPIDTTPVQ